METPPELFVLACGVHPRRILLYLAEKGLFPSLVINTTPVQITEHGFDAPGKPPGSVPILRLPNGIAIKQLIAILNYFEAAA
ncbi:hypothetical protein BDV29DRAFT_157492 [Aspergillus leporis]|uniref:GST N-terminal domain-containing protein n=1 Tax=Aspergillus leporis TaxID=41062 RepID=A0A5N5WYU8_9EURO|nr:hypothetical protein BDV29DRAFT_157492 [Aspergillus leporis]